MNQYRPNNIIWCVQDDETKWDKVLYSDFEFMQNSISFNGKVVNVKLKPQLLEEIGYVYEKHVNLELWHSPNEMYSLARNVHNEFYIFNLGIQMHDIKYLDQLQNLHFALYQEELKIDI